ncbi:MAG: FecR family protein [Planctomycetota bacterium]|nr:FecR family protein [Planctomycetota bacterium]
MTGSAHDFSELERLLNASVDGELSDADEASLQALLRDDAAARRRYLQFMQLHAELHWDHGADASLLVTPEHQSPGISHFDGNATQRVGGWMIPAVAIGVVAAAWLMTVGWFTFDGGGEHRSQTAPMIARLEMTQGTVSFRAAGGEQVALSRRGQDLTAGALLVEGETSAAQWRFLDGTLITASGDAEISFDDVGQKVIRARQGMLTAEVQPQLTSAPLIVETPTARVEVLGTVFTLAADPDTTRINVAEGRVRLKRLVDGETVEVSQQQSCIVSLDARSDLSPEVSVEPQIGWQHHFTEPPPARWKGVWQAPEGNLPARVRAVACLVGRKHEADDTPIVHYGITARRVDEMNLGSLPTNGVLRVRLRMEQPAKLHIMLGLNRADGGFGGNFEVKLPHDAGTPQPDGWRELVVPLADFQPVVPRKPDMPSAARPYLILITTYGDDAGLEVCELAIESVETSW